MTLTQENYNHKLSEKKWQEAWQEADIYKFDEKSAKEKYYVLEMFPYPSGKIHMGHLRNYAIGDVIARFKKMQGFNVLHPLGFDSFGLPAENAALEHKIHPQDWTLKNIEIMRDELKSIGLSIDWNREVITCLPNYYKHEQEIFLEFFKNGLAYQKESFVNWDPIDKTVLANEQVIDGRGWRSGALVEKKKLKQWFLRVSDFSEELLTELKNLQGWDERVLSMQEKWIGKSEGLKLRFKLNYNIKPDACQEKSEFLGEFLEIEVYTTRPDTIFGASFIAISPNHPVAQNLAQNDTKIAEFVNECNKNAVNEEVLEKQEKLGINTGLKVLHPFDENLEIDVFIANFVLMDYGSGAVFGCPAHDERDFEFAKKYNLKIKKVVANLNDFLQENEIIDFNDKEIAKIVKNLQEKSKNEVEFVKNAVKFVALEISYPPEKEEFKTQKPNLKASEVLKNKNAFCFGKANLLAALLRKNKIPCGFCDQLLVLDEENPQKKIIHTLNAVYFQEQKKWLRIDSRYFDEEKIEKSFADFCDLLAYEAEEKFDEIDNLGIYHNLPKEVFELYEKSQNNQEIVANLFDKSSAFEVDEAFTESGIAINSEFLNGLTSAEAKEKIINEAQKLKIGERKVNYRLRDWGVSRQRYWGCPIPILYLENGEVVAVPKKDLPIELPKDVVFDGNGNPLANHPTWKYTKYVDENGKTHNAIRETDTFDTFFESSWYFLRYISAPNDKAFEKDLVNKFMPVDQYVGGVEHAVLHLLYARFFVKALKKCGYLNFDEPFKNLLTQGMVCHQTFKDKNGKWIFPTDAIEEEKGKFIHIKTKEEVFAGRSEKMSKSKKNVVEPAGIIDSYGADTARLFMLSDSPANRDLEWSEAGIDGAWKYVNRISKLVCAFTASDFKKNIKNPKKLFDKMQNYEIADLNNLNKNSQEIIKLTHKTIKEVGEEFDKNGFNRAIAKIREFSNALEKFQVQDDDSAQIMFFALANFVMLFAAIMPHLAQECWKLLGFEDFVASADFPKYNEKLIIEDKVKIVVQVASRTRAILELKKGTDAKEIEKLARENENVAKFLQNANVKKVVIVEDKLINFVV